MKPGRVVIKKYGNRRLYDTAASRYVNLDEIAARVRQGADVQVVDAQTGEDLTRVILTQIIVEDARKQPAALPLELLRQIIVASDHVGREFITWYLNSAFDAYRKVQSAVESGFGQVRSAALSPLEMMRDFLAKKPPEEPAADELEELRRRVAELERSRVKKRRTARGARRKA